MGFRQTFPRGFLRKSCSSFLAAALAVSSIQPSAWARRDEDYYNNYRPQTYNSQNLNTYKPPKVEIKTPNMTFLQAPTGRLDTESRGLIRAISALNPAKLPDIKSSPTIKTEQPAFRPLALQFKPLQVQTPGRNALEVGQNKLNPAGASTPKTGILAGVQKVFTAVGQAFAGAGQKIVNAFKAVVQAFRGQNKELAAMTQQLVQNNASLKEVRPGVLQTAPGTQTFANRRMWEPGSTFQATESGPKLIEGVTFESNFESLSRADGKAMPIKMRGTPDGVEAVGLDFNRIAAGTTFKSSTPIELPSAGSFQADQITYSGPKNGDPILEVQGKGKLSVESITDAKVMKQAEQQLSLKLRLQNETFQVKDAVLTVGKEKTYLDGQGKATPVSAIKKDVQGVSSQAVPLLKDAKVQAVSAEQNGRAINGLLKNLTDQTGNTLSSPLQTSNEAQAFLSSVADLSNKSNAAQTALESEDYGVALAAIPSLQADMANLQASQAEVAGKVTALRQFSKSLSDLTRDLRDLYPQIDREGMVEQKHLRPDVLADRVARFFPEEKGRFATHTDKALVSLIALTESGEVDPTTARAWGQTLITARNQVFGAMPEDRGAEKIAHVAAHPQETSTKVIDKGMDEFFFNTMDQWAESYPRTMHVVGGTGYWGSQVAYRGSQATGIVALGYFAWAAPVVTGGSALAGWGTKKALLAAGANEDAASFYGTVAALLSPIGLSKLPGQGNVAEVVASLRGETSRILAGEGGFVRLLGKPRGTTLAESKLKTLDDLPGPTLPKEVVITYRNGVYQNRRLASEEVFFKYHGRNNRTGKEFSWFTKQKYPTEAALRSDLAIRHDWGVKITGVSEFRAPAGTWVSEGIAAHQGQGYPGGGYQAVVKEVPRSWVIRTNKAFN